MLDPNNPPSPPTIMVMMPCYGGKVFLETLESLLQLQREALENGIDILYHFNDKCSLISLGRSIMACNVYKTDDTWTHMLWIDADVGFTMDDVWKLLIADKDIVGGMYPFKRFPIEWTSAPYPMTGGKHEGDNLVQTDYVATGFMLIKREAYAKMHEQFKDELKFRYWDQDFVHLFEPIIDKDRDNLYLSEDYAFCKRAASAGLEAWVRNDVRLTHTGSTVYSEEEQALMLSRLQDSLVKGSVSKNPPLSVTLKPQ